MTSFSCNTNPDIRNLLSPDFEANVTEEIRALTDTPFNNFLHTEGCQCCPQLSKIPHAQTETSIARPPPYMRPLAFTQNVGLSKQVPV